ncbi:DUF4157 domain-containing protein [Ascidiimonas sp. W6]|uniref:eCIS core domain-containing protein n=1 Tax=Ascidiimonas meishanensis TaxID=3128903 RepID=UPI0030EC40F1
MNSPASKRLKNKSLLVSSEPSQLQSGSEFPFQFVDNRIAAQQLKKLEVIANKNPKTLQLKAFQEIANNSPKAKQLAQLKIRVANLSNQEHQPIQKKESLESTAKENRTGLPDNLKSGIENLSGYAMDDVKVHYNSNKPAQLQAHAYAQGTDIHLASGQEKHLPHEAWHVVQQKQGRVRPTLQMKGNVNVNDDKGLEKEADLMGTKAFQFVENQTQTIAQRKLKEIANNSPQVKQMAKLQLVANNHSASNFSHKTFSQGVIQLAAYIDVDSGGTITSVSLDERPSKFRKSTLSALGPAPSSGMHRCHEEPSMGMQARIIYKYTNKQLATVAAGFGVSTQAEVEKAIWKEYLDDYHEPDNLHWGGGSANSSDGAKARALRDALFKDDLGQVTYPLTVGSNTFNDRTELEQEAITFGIDTTDPTKKAAIEASYRSEGCTIL